MTAQRKRKRLNNPQTRAKILAAAQRAFGESGYSGTGIRQIAAIAGVSDSLIIRYFGTKAGLFEAVLTEMNPLDSFLLEVDRRQFGKQVANLILDTGQDLKASSMFTLSMGEETQSITTRVAEEKVIAPLAKWLGPPDAQVRALQIIMLCTGLLAFSRRLPVLPNVRSKNRLLRRWFADALQAIVDQS